MPVDRRHAFGQGGAYPIEPRARALEFPGVLRRLARRLREYEERQRAASISQCFWDNAVVGSNCRVGPNAWCVNAGARDHLRIGDEVICRGLLRCETFSPGRLSIASDVYIGDDCIISCAEEISIGSFTLLAHGAQIFDNDSHPIDPMERERDYRAVQRKARDQRARIESAPVVIGERVWLGLNSIVLKGVRIGDGSIIAAGSVVTSDIPEMCIAAGNPARVVSRLGESS